MKTHDFRFNPNLLAVELPEGNGEVSVGLHCIGIKPVPNGKEVNDTNDYFHIYTEMFHGYKLLGKLTDLTEEMARPLVELGDADPVGKRVVLGYKSYFDGYEDDSPQFTCSTALESLESGIESEIPEWDKNKTIIFKKV